MSKAFLTLFEGIEKFLEGNYPNPHCESGADYAYFEGLLNTAMSQLTLREQVAMVDLPELKA